MPILQQRNPPGELRTAELRAESAEMRVFKGGEGTGRFKPYHWASRHRESDFWVLCIDPGGGGKGGGGRDSKGKGVCVISHLPHGVFIKMKASPSRIEREKKKKKKKALSLPVLLSPTCF